MLGHVHVVGLDGMWEFFHGKSGRPKVLLLPHPEYDASEPPPPWLKAVALAFNHTDPYKTAFFAYVPPAESERIAQLFGASQLPALLGCRASIMWGWTTHIYSPELTAQAMAARDASDPSRWPAEFDASHMTQFITDVLDKSARDDDAAHRTRKFPKLPHPPREEPMAHTLDGGHGTNTKVVRNHKARKLVHSGKAEL